MKDLSAADLLVGEIASALDAALADPARAPLVKAAMRARLSQKTDAEAAHDDADAEDLWENVPV